jgi:hypothetical protein
LIAQLEVGVPLEAEEQPSPAMLPPIVGRDPGDETTAYDPAAA